MGYVYCFVFFKIKINSLLNGWVILKTVSENKIIPKNRLAESARAKHQQYIM